MVQVVPSCVSKGLGSGGPKSQPHSVNTRLACSYNSPSRFIIVSHPHNADTERMRNPNYYIEARVKILEDYVWWLRLWFFMAAGAGTALIACLILWAKYIPKQ